MAHSFTPYPDIDDPDFYDILFRKKEFNKTLYPSEYRYLTTEDLCRKGEFKMQNHQEFVRNFLSPETPYNGVALIHGTGAGKTCAAIGTTEGLRDYARKGGKIYILSSENIRPNFYKELYNPEKEEIEREYHSMPGSYQCAGDRYYLKATDGSAKIKAAHSMIREYYEFFGFGQFANFVDVGLGAKLPAHMVEKGPKITNEDGTLIDIGDYFANTVIVIDEAHGIAGEDKKSKKKMETEQQGQEQEDQSFELSDQEEEEVDESYNATGNRGKRAITTRSLFKVLLDTVIPACHAKGHKLKLILLTATPMKDNVRELADLLELLNVNDQRLDPLDRAWRSEIFPVGMTREDLNDSQRVDRLRELCRGYISYIKGENPITYPTAILPPADYLYEPAREDDGLSMHPMLPYRARDDGRYTDISETYNVLLDNGDPFRFELVKCPMSIYHNKCYVSQLTGRQSKTKSKKNKDSSDTHTRMISNICFPHPEMNDFLEGGEIENHNRTYGNAGFNAMFTKKVVHLSETKKIDTYHYRSDIWSSFGNFLGQTNSISETDVLSLYSKKLDTFLNFVNGFTPEDPETRIAPSGIVYAYSEFVKAGALIMALILEANGYVRYSQELESHLDASGLPENDVRNKFPQISRLHMPEEGHPSNGDFYRCALCGRVYNECREYDQYATTKHKFKVATYILVTGSIGGVKDIAEATQKNIDGSKVKVILGTKTTGTGVDLRWVRQVHIIDPWHNNTRIYQAIGRGLRHCSHADLPPEKRNVTIYKYSSVPDGQFIIDVDTGELPEDIMDQHKLDQDVVYTTEDGDEIPLYLEYRDFVTESVDEHMYRRVVRKDLLIMSIMRILKESAIDCELNRIRNYFPGYDQDYTRECDYTLCKYNCHGFIEPIKYIRTIRRVPSSTSDDGYDWFIVDDENAIVGVVGELIDNEYIASRVHGNAHTNLELWQQFTNHHKVTAEDDYEEVLVDIPLVTVDNSTYDIYFSAPQIDRATKIITRIYQDHVTLSLKKLVYLTRQRDPNLEEQFIYMALDRLIGKPPKIKPKTLYDKFGRRCYLFYHNGFYILQPYEIKDKSIPLQYRKRPVSIKRRFYNMNVLKPPEVTKRVDVVYELDKAKIEALLAKYRDKPNYSSITDLCELYFDLNKLIPSEHRYIVELLILNIFQVSNLDELSVNDAYILEYYIRTGLLLLSGWHPKMSGTGDHDTDGIIGLFSYLREIKADSVVKLQHLFQVDGNLRQLTYGRPQSTYKWYWETVTNYDEEDITVDEMKYPTAPPINRSAAHCGVKTLYPSLNNVDDGIYTFIAKAKTHRAARPLIGIGELVPYLKNVVKRLQKEYPDDIQMKKASFKIVDHATKRTVVTRTQQTTRRTELRGQVCSSFDSNALQNTIDRVTEVLKMVYISDIFPYESIDEEDYFALLELDAMIGDKKRVCQHLEKLCLILDYYQVNNVKWYLTPIETEYYRPSSDKKK